MLSELIRNHWWILQYKVHGGIGRCSDDRQDDCNDFVNVFLGSGNAALARGAETRMSASQVAHRMLCDLTTAAEDWIPVMTRLELAYYANDQLREPGVFSLDSTQEGRSPYQCGLPAAFRNTGIGDLCPDSVATDRFRCESADDCTGPWGNGYACSPMVSSNPALGSCCEPIPVIR